MPVLPRPIILLLMVLAALLVCYPLYGEWLLGDKAEFFMQKLTTIMIFAVFALSLELLVGLTGLVSLGHALFFGLAGYCLVLLTPEYETVSLWWALPVSLLITGIVAAIVGMLCIRTAGVYFIMVTLAFGQMGFYLFNDSDLAGGSDGLFIYFKPTLTLAGVTLLDLENRQTFFYLTLVFLIAVFILLWRLSRSPFGRVIIGIRDNEHRVRALGYNATLYKLVSFILAAMLAGLAGFLFVAQYGFANPSLLGWHQSGHVLMMVILGGMGTLFGPMLGALIFELLHYGYESLTEHWLLLMGLTIIAVVALLPGGIGGLLLSLTTSRTAPEPDDE